MEGRKIPLLALSIFFSSPILGGFRNLPNLCSKKLSNFVQQKIVFVQKVLCVAGCGKG